MKRHRFLNFRIDTIKSFFKEDTDPLNEAILKGIREEHRDYISEKYGKEDFESKFERWKSIPTPALSLIGEHSHLLKDIENAYVLGSYYSALTAACCLGERMFNHIILGIKESYITSEYYKQIKKTIINWDLAIRILVDWKIILPEVEARYNSLYKIRTNSVHFQNKDQDLEAIAKEAIVLINTIVSDLFEINKRKSFILWFDVPGELYLKKEYESDPFIKKFYIPATINVGYKHKILTNDQGQHYIKDIEYPDQNITDLEFVNLRNGFNDLTSKT